MKLKNILKKTPLLCGDPSKNEVFICKIPTKEGRVIESHIGNIPFEDFLGPHMWGEEGWKEILEQRRFMSEDFDKHSDKEQREHMEWIHLVFCHMFQCDNPLMFYPPLDFKERVEKGLLKKGDLDRCLIFGGGVCYVDTYEVGKIINSHIGTNLKLVLSTLQNLNSSFLDGWKFRKGKVDQQNLSELKHIFIRYSYSYGECLILENENIGRINLYEDKNSTDNEIWLELIEVWGKRTLNGEEKGSVGRSLLTLLNRIVKGYDIVLRLNVGDVSREQNHTPYDKQKLIKWYESNGFQIETEDLNEGLLEMSNIDILEEYWSRLEEEGKDQSRLDEIQKKIEEVEKVDISKVDINEVFGK